MQKLRMKRIFEYEDLRPVIDKLLQDKGLTYEI